MDFEEVKQRALEIRKKYEEFEKEKWGKIWGKEQLLQGFIVDVGDLTRIIMQKEGWRKSSAAGEIEHELVDCLWCVIVLADKYGVDLEKEFKKTMDQLEERIAKREDH